jgi:hypothetical protein
MIGRSIIVMLACVPILFLGSSGIAKDVGQYLPDEWPSPDGLPYSPDEWPSYPNVSPYSPDEWPSYPDVLPYSPDEWPSYPDVLPSYPDGGYSQHPATGPVGSPPSLAPSDSTTGALGYAQGEELTARDIQATGGALMAHAIISNLQLWIWYNGYWTTGSAAVRYTRSTSTVTYNDRSQYIWSWELYPNGIQIWNGPRYMRAGYIHGLFTGDMPGWHQLAMWGSRSGWSNSVWIYVR